MKVYAATGHRPDKLGGYSPQAERKLLDFAIVTLAADRPDKCISGMALGWDTAFAEAAFRLCIPYVAAVPFEGQETMWQTLQRAKYHLLLSAAMEIKIVSPGGFSSRAMQARNVWMVDNCTKLISLFDGSPGGTWNCMWYADSKSKPIRNMWAEFSQF